jgi:hypothetical protein
MQTPQHFTNHYASPDVDNCVKNLEHELTDFANVQAPADAKKNHELTQSYYKIQVLDFVHSRVQGSIDFIRRTLLVVPEIFNSKELEQVAQKNVDEIDQRVNDNKHIQASLTRKRNLVILDPLKRKYGKWFFIAAIIVGAGDAVLSFFNFTAGTYPVILALFAATAIGTVISISHVGYVPWIQKAENKRERVIRITIVLLVSFVLFAWLGNLRASASNSAINIELSGHEVSAVTPTHLNGWAIAMVSFVLFVGIFSTSLILWKNEKERLAEQEYDKLTGEIDTIKSSIEAMGKKKEAIINNVLAQKSEARKKFDLLKTAIPLCKSIGINAIVTYKQVYSRSNHNIPVFFNDPVNFQYDETIQFFQSPQTDHA